LVILPPKASIEYALFPLSNGTGALINGWVVDFAGYRPMFVTAATLCGTRLILTWRFWAKLK